MCYGSPRDPGGSCEPARVSDVLFGKCPTRATGDFCNEKLQPRNTASNAQRSGLFYVNGFDDLVLGRLWDQGPETRGVGP